MTTSIKSGNASVVESGTVFSFNDQPIEFLLTDIEIKGSSYKLKFSFAYDANNPAPRWIFGKDHAANCFHMELINHNNPLGTGILSPIKVASNKLGIQYLIAFMVSSWEQKLSKKFAYTIFRVETQNNNQGN